MKLKSGLIVSCQATPDEPLYGNIYMQRMAVAAEMGGAVAVRVNTTADIIACLKAINIPLIGLVKRNYEGYYPYISPTMREVDELMSCGCEIIAVDATHYERPDGKKLDDFISSIRSKYDVEILADVSTVKEGIYVSNLDVDYVATTLNGYTPETIECDNNKIVELREPNFNLIKELSSKIDKPIIAEGRFWNEIYALKALKAGAHAVTIGAGITRPQIITKKIVDELNKYISGEKDEIRE